MFPPRKDECRRPTRKSVSQSCVLPVDHTHGTKAALKSIAVGTLVSRAQWTLGRGPERLSKRCSMRDAGAARRTRQKLRTISHRQLSPDRAKRVPRSGRQYGRVAHFCKAKRKTEDVAVGAAKHSVELSITRYRGGSQATWR